MKLDEIRIGGGDSMPPAIFRVLSDVKAERGRQDARWGEQHHADVDPVLMNRPGGCTARRMAEEYGIPTASRARQACQARGSVVRPDTWAHILIEEIAEAIEAAVTGSKAELREELIQCAAVIVNWIEDIDSRVRVENVSD